MLLSAPNVGSLRFLPDPPKGIHCSTKVLAKIGSHTLPPMSDPSSTLFIGSLPHDVCVDDLEKAFSGTSGLVSYRLRKDRNNRYT